MVVTLSPEYPVFLKSHQFQEYCEDYARHFDIIKDWVFNTTVKKASRSVDDTKWCLEVETAGQEPQMLQFDKVVFAHGYQTKAFVPQFEGQEMFEGVIMHSQQYRKQVSFCPSPYLIS